MENLAKHLINFYAFIQHYSFELPSDIKSIQPYKGEVFENIRSFFTTYYSDTKPRSLILGINPGRKGAGVTGLPFTDSKRLQGLLNHKVSNQKQSYEPSSEFFYKAIAQYGGPKKFYTDFIVSSVSPVGFLRCNERNNWVNYNYYDDKALKNLCIPFIKETMDLLLQLPINRKQVLCLGSGKNFKELQALNEIYRWFEVVIPIEHPRYIIQYKRKDIDQYSLKYTQTLNSIKKSQLHS